MTLRTQVSDILNTINANWQQIDHVQAAEYAYRLSVLYGTMIEHTAQLESACNAQLVELLDTIVVMDGTKKKRLSVAEADARVKASPAWLEWQSARALTKGTEETITALKKYATVKASEYTHTI